AAAKLLTHIVGYRSHVGSRADVGAESGLIARNVEKLKLPNLNLYRLERDYLMFAGEFVGWNTGDLLGRKRRGRLLQHAVELRCQDPDLFEFQNYALRRRSRVAVGIVRGCRKAEADCSLISLLRVHVELRQTRKVADDDRQHSSGGRIERS